MFETDRTVSGTAWNDYPGGRTTGMAIERWLVWLVGLAAVAASVAAYATPGLRFPADPVLAALVGVVALPFLFVFGRLLLALRGGTRGWS